MSSTWLQRREKRSSDVMKMSGTEVKGVKVYWIYV